MTVLSVNTPVDHCNVVAILPNGWLVLVVDKETGLLEETITNA